MSLKYVKVKPIKRTPPFRQIALGTWNGPGDPQIYGSIDIDLTRAYEWREREGMGGPKITVLSMVARAVGLAMKRYPDLNGFIRFGRIYLRDTVDIFFQVATEHESGRTDLTGVHIKEVDRKGVREIAAEMAEKVERVKKRRDTDLQKTAGRFARLPAWLVKCLLRLSSFISYGLNIHFPGIPDDSFGGCMISNVGALGLDVAFAPLVPYSRVPMVLILGEARQRPVGIQGKIEARETVPLNATIDHRFCDGMLIARMVKVIREVFEDPDRYF